MHALFDSLQPYSLNLTDRSISNSIIQRLRASTWTAAILSTSEEKVLKTRREAVKDSWRNGWKVQKNWEKIASFQSTCGRGSDDWADVGADVWWHDDYLEEKTRQECLGCTRLGIKYHMRVIMGAYLCAVPEADFNKQFHLVFLLNPTVILDSRRLV